MTNYVSYELHLYFTNQEKILCAFKETIVIPFRCLCSLEWLKGPFKNDMSHAIMGYE